MDKDLKKLIKKAEKQGFTWDQTSKGHVRFFKDGTKITTFAGTPSDSRGWKNGMSDLKAAGFIDNR